jgi:hypothetical protein
MRVYFKVDQLMSQSAGGEAECASLGRLCHKLQALEPARLAALVGGLGAKLVQIRERVFGLLGGWFGCSITTSVVVMAPGPQACVKLVGYIRTVGNLAGRHVRQICPCCSDCAGMKNDGAHCGSTYNVHDGLEPFLRVQPANKESLLMLNSTCRPAKVGFQDWQHQRTAPTVFVKHYKTFRNQMYPESCSSSTGARVHWG